MKIFSFKVLAKDFEEDQGYTLTGLIPASSYSDAMEKIEAYFGEDIESVLNLSLIDDGELIFLPEKMIKEYESTTNPEIKFQEPYVKK